MKWSYAVQNLRSGASSSNLNAMAVPSINNVVVRACIARPITLSKRVGAIPRAGETVALVLCGANLDPSTLA